MKANRLPPLLPPPFPPSPLHPLLRLHLRARRARACPRGLLLAALLLVLTGCHQAESPSAPRGPMRPGADAAMQTVVLQARSIRVQDGDSFIARLDDGSRRTIRLSGIDAPERRQPHADRSRQSLQRLLDKRELRVHVANTDRYGRAVAQVFVVAPNAPNAQVDVGLAQVEAGMAWFFRRFRSDLPPAAGDRYAEAEQAARQATRGLWQSTDPEPPWDFRRRGQPGDRTPAR